jgi:hypothetical protein
MDTDPKFALKYIKIQRIQLKSKQSLSINIAQRNSVWTLKIKIRFLESRHLHVPRFFTLFELTALSGINRHGELDRQSEKSEKNITQLPRREPLLPRHHALQKAPAALYTGPSHPSELAQCLSVSRSLKKIPHRILATRQFHVLRVWRFYFTFRTRHQYVALDTDTALAFGNK